VVLLLELNQNLIADHLNLPCLPLSTADQIRRKRRSSIGMSVIERVKRNSGERREIA
jgi:hypothetical protein